MEDSKQKLIQMILKLLNLGDAEKNSNEAERELAQRKAAELMAKHSIDFAELRANKPQDNPFVKFRVEGTDVHQVDWEAILAKVIADAFDCDVLSSSTVLSWHLTFVGGKTDLEIAVFFFKYLRRTVGAMARKNVGFDSTGMRSDKRLEEARASYAFGMVQTIGRRLEDLYKKKQEFIPSDCKALIIRKRDDLAEFIAKEFPNTRTQRLGSMKHYGAYSQGRADGEKVNLSRPIEHHANGERRQIG